MTAQPAFKTPFSAEDYFAWEETQELRHEYYHGEVFAMSGGTANHALLAASVIAVLSAALRGCGCRVYSSDLRVQLADGMHYVYPDLTVVCGPPHFTSDRQTTLLNPTLVVEVLSDSTQGYDRGAKFAAYRGVPSLREVVFVAQDRPALEAFRRDDAGRWTLYEPEAGALTLESVGATLLLDDVYDGVDFAHPDGPPAAVVEG